MPTPNAPHRPKQPNFRRPHLVAARRIVTSSFLLALLVSLIAYAVGAAGVAHVRDTAPARTRCGRRCRDDSVLWRRRRRL